MSVRAKFRCHTVKLYSGSDASDTTPSVELSPVYRGPDASEEDKAFWQSTPQGKIEMTITNPNAAEFFEVGKTYYADFSVADD